MSRVRRAITAFFFFFFFLERMYACRIHHLFPKSWGWGGGGGVGGSVGRRVDVQARVVYVSECVCLLYPSIFIFYSSFCFG